MRNIILFVLTVLLLTACNTTSEDLIRKSLFTNDWKFHKGDLDNAFKKTTNPDLWVPVSIPHDWAIEGEFSSENSSGTGYLPGGIGWYRKEFTLDENYKGKTVYIQFDGAYQKAKVWLNGQLIGYRPYGYSSFVFDLSDYLLYGEDNILAVRLDHSNTGDSRWYTGNGIYRNVWMIVADKTHVKPWGTFVYAKNINHDSAEVFFDVDIVNNREDNGNIVIKNEILNALGQVIGEKMDEVIIQPGSETRFNGQIHISDPSLWSPENPVLYQLKTTLLKGNLIIDKYTTNFGIRYYSFDPHKGFQCNGKSYKLNGICLHHDFGPLGAARHPKSAYMILKKLKKAGTNAIRTSHNPEDPEFLTMLDTMGFFVMEEAFDEWRYGKKKWLKGRNVGREEGEDGLGIYYSTNGYSDLFEEWAEQDIKDMIRRDRNHPSIIMWSIGNEIDYPNDPYADKNDDFWEPSKPDPVELDDIAAILTGYIKEYDTTRPVTAALANIPVANKVGYPDVLDIVGYNYQEKYYEQDHKNYPDRIIYGSENGDSQRAWRAVADNDFISGQFLWTGMDYHGEAGQFPRHSAGAGIMDMCGFEKPVYYERMSWWTDLPMIKGVVRSRSNESGYSRYNPVMHWNFEVGQLLDIGCYTNCEETEIIINGESLGRKKGQEKQMVKTEFKSGKVLFKGFINDQCVCMDSLITSEGFTRLELKNEEAFLASDGKDIVHIMIQATDDNGIPFPAANQEINFEISGGGELLAVGNGNLSSTEPYRGNKRSLYEGKAMAIIKSNGSLQDVNLLARYDNIISELKIKVK